MAAAMDVGGLDIRRRICELSKALQRLTALTKKSQLAALSQCIATYLTVGKYGLGSDVEDRVISSGEAWIKVNGSP